MGYKMDPVSPDVPGDYREIFMKKTLIPLAEQCRALGDTRGEEVFREALRILYDFSALGIKHRGSELPGNAHSITLDVDTASAARYGDDRQAVISIFRRISAEAYPLGRNIAVIRARPASEILEMGAEALALFGEGPENHKLGVLMGKSRISEILNEELASFI
jgi:hypothetical protein